jgi:hypothetical protein
MGETRQQKLLRNQLEEFSKAIEDALDQIRKPSEPRFPALPWVASAILLVLSIGSGVAALGLQEAAAPVLLSSDDAIALNPVQIGISASPATVAALDGQASVVSDIPTGGSNWAVGINRNPQEPSSIGYGLTDLTRSRGLHIDEPLEVRFQLPPTSTLANKNCATWYTDSGESHSALAVVDSHYVSNLTPLSQRPVIVSCTVPPIQNFETLTLGVSFHWSGQGQPDDFSGVGKVAITNPYWWSVDFASSYQVLDELQQTSLPYSLTLVPRKDEQVESESWQPTKQTGHYPEWNLSPDDEIRLVFRTQSTQVALALFSQILWLAAGIMLGAAPGVFLGGLSARSRKRKGRARNR